MVHEIKKNKSELNDSISTSLTLATYNVQSFGNEITGYSCKEIARYMQNEEADILCFQEFQDSQYFPIDSIRRILSHWQYVCVPSKDSIQGILPIAVFSRYPIIRHKYITYTGSFNCSMFCDIVVKGDTIRLINNHLQTTSVSLNRRKWERELTSRDSKREVIAMQNEGLTIKSFTLNVGDGIQTRGHAELSRYVMEIYEGTTAAGTPAVHKEQATGTFANVVLKDKQAYTVLFWADYGTPTVSGETPSVSNEYDATDLKAARIVAGKQPNFEAYAGASKFTVGTDDEAAYTQVALTHDTRR